MTTKVLMAIWCSLSRHFSLRVESDWSVSDGLSAEGLLAVIVILMLLQRNNNNKNNNLKK